MNKLEYVCGLIALAVIVGVSFFAGMQYQIAQTNKLTELNINTLKRVLADKDKNEHDIVIGDKYIIAIRRTDGNDVTATNLENED